VRIVTTPLSRGAEVQRKSPVELNNEAKQVCRDARSEFASNLSVARRGKGDGAGKQGKAGWQNQRPQAERSLAPYT
jgi:hypothetical protein